MHKRRDTDHKAGLSLPSGATGIERPGAMREFHNRTIRRHQLREIVPLADTTIYELEQKGEFPKRFYLTPRCVVWDLLEVEAWIEQRRSASQTNSLDRSSHPDVRLRKSRRVKQPRQSGR